MLLVRSGPVNRDLGGSVHIWGDNAPVLISYFYDGAAPVEVFQNRSQSGFYMDITSILYLFIIISIFCFCSRAYFKPEGKCGVRFSAVRGLRLNDVMPIQSSY